MDNKITPENTIKRLKLSEERLMLNKMIFNGLRKEVMHKPDDPFL